MASSCLDYCSLFPSSLAEVPRPRASGEQSPTLTASGLRAGMGVSWLGNPVPSSVKGRAGEGHSSRHSLTPSLSHLLTSHSLILLFAHPLTQPFTHSFIHSLPIHSLIIHQAPPMHWTLARASGGGPASLTGTDVPHERVLSVPHHPTCQEVCVPNKCCHNQRKGVSRLEIMPLPQIHSEGQARQSFALTALLHITVSSRMPVLRPRAGRKPGQAMGGSHVCSNKGDTTMPMKNVYQALSLSQPFPRVS